jgi:hypothetical protein
MALRESSGTASLRSSSRVPRSAVVRFATPATFPQAAHDGDEPRAHGIGSEREEDRDQRGGVCSSHGRWRPRRDNDLDGERDELGNAVVKPPRLSLGAPTLHGDGLALHRAQRAQPLESRELWGGIFPQRPCIPSPLKR